MPVKFMSVREFLRGGYRDPERAHDTVVVLNGSEPAGSWYPGRTGIAIEATQRAKPTSPAPPPFRPAPKPSKRSGRG